MSELVIFDCDGVLVDSEVLVSEAESVLLADLGLHLAPRDITELFVGLSEPDVAEQVRQRWGLVLDEAFSRTKATKVLELLRSSLQPVVGMADVLAGLGARRCVASSSSPERIRLSLEVTGLARYFGDDIFSSTMVERGKPAPDLFLLAARRMSALPEHCVVVEDSPFGVEAGRAAGMRVIGFTGASHNVGNSAERLRSAGASEVVGCAPALKDALALALGETGPG